LSVLGSGPLVPTVFCTKERERKKWSANETGRDRNVPSLPCREWGKEKRNALNFHTNMQEI